MPNQSSGLDRVFHALSDPTRRAVLAQLSSGPAAVSELAKRFEMALPSFTQHLGVLEKCGLVRSRKSGRIRTYQLTPKPLEAVESWIQRHREIWEQRFDRLDSYLEEMKEK